jgi:HEAT repeat protein
VENNTAEIARLLREMSTRYAIPRKKAADALVALGADAVSGLIEKLNDKNPDVQQAAADALERIATPEASAAVVAWNSAHSG